MRISWHRGMGRFAFETLPGHGDYFDWGFRPASRPLSILELGPIWVSWYR